MKCSAIQLNNKKCMRCVTRKDGKCGYHTKSKVKKIRSEAIKKIDYRRPTRILRKSKFISPSKIYTEKQILNKEYPYKKYYINLNQLLREAKNFKPFFGSDDLRNQAIEGLNLKKYKNDYQIIFTDFTNGGPKINNLTDFYTEKCRLECRRENKFLTPLETYKRKKFMFFQEAKQNLRYLTLENFNHFLDRKINNCSNYKLSYLLGLMDIFKPKRWLDMSAGWGDRLMSAILSGVERYLGVDPNSCLHPHYKEIVKDLIPLNQQKNYEVLLGQAENIKLPNEKFDFVFTSPPFFTFEIYNEKGENKELQSTFNYKNIKDWLNNFLYKMIDNSWEYLEKGGNFILYIEDKPDYPFIPELIKYFENKENSVYDGIIYQIPYLGNKNPPFFKFHTLYCWHKT